VLVSSLEVCDAHELEVGQVDKTEEVVENQVEHVAEIRDSVVRLSAQISH